MRSRREIAEMREAERRADELRQWFRAFMRDVERRKREVRR